MKISCINLNGASAHISSLQSELNNDFSPKQIAVLWNKWLSENTTRGLPTKEDILFTYTQIENSTSQEILNNQTISDKTEIIDMLQYLYFDLMYQAADKPVLTREDIANNQSAVYEQIPDILRENGLSNIADNFEFYKEYLINQRLTKFNVPEDIDESEVIKDTISNSSSIYDDSFNRGSDEVKYLLASLKSTEEAYGLPKPVNFTQVKNTLQNYLAGTLGFDEMANKLIAVQNDYDWIPELLEKLGIIEENDYMPEAIYGSVRTSFHEAFAKQLLDITIAKVGGKDSYSALDHQQILNLIDKGQSQFWANKTFSKFIKGKRVLNRVAYNQLHLGKSDIDLRTFLSIFGINLNEAVPIEGQLRADIEFIKKQVESFIEKKEDVEWLNDKDLDVKSRVNNILLAQVPFEKLQQNLSVNNAEGKSQYAISNNNYISRVTSKLIHGTKQAINQFEKLLKDKQLILNFVSGIKNDSGDTSTFDKLGITDIYTTQLSAMFSNKPTIQLPRTADKTTERAVEFVGKDPNQEMAWTTIQPQLITKLYKSFLTDKAQTFHPNWTYADEANPLSFWEALGITKDMTEPQFDIVIRRYIQNLQLETYKEFENNKVFVKKNGGFKVLFSDAALNKMGWNNIPKGQSKENYQRGLLLELIDNYNFNNLYFGIMSTQSFQGSMSGVNPDNFFKRTAGPAAESRTPRTDKLIVDELNAEMRLLGLNNFNADTLTVQVHSKTINPTTDKDILAISKDYAKNDEDDAQGIMIFPMYKAILKMTSQWTNKQEAAYQKIMKGQALTKDEKGLFQPIKPVGFSVINKDGSKIPIYIKTAVYPMSLADVKGTANEAKYNASIKRGIGLWIPKTGIKMATPNNLKSVGEGINEDAIFDFPMSDFGIQLDVNAKNSTKQLIGTQQRKLKWNNLFKAGQALSEKFKALFEADKQNIQDMSNLQKEKLYKEMGIEENGVDDITIKNFNKFKELVKKELISRDNPINTIEAINSVIDENGNVILSIDSLPSRQKIMNLLNAIINNRLIKQYTNGTTLVQISQQGWEMPEGSTIDTPTSIDFVSKKDKENYLKNKGLSFFKLGETTAAAECILPAKYKKFVKKDENGDYILDEQVLINIGYRIPTQGHNSMLHLKVVGFLPEHLDQMIILPKEITTQGGSDFDVDKINLFIPNPVNVDGQVTYISPEMDPEEIYEKIKNEQENKEITNKLFAKIFGTVNSEGNIEDYEIGEEEEDENISNKDLFIQKFKEKQLQNKNIEITVAILEDSEQATSLITPNSPGALKKKSEDITKQLLAANKTPKKLSISLANMFNGTTLAKITNQMFASKALVGIFASQATHHTLAQQVGLHFKTTTRPFYFNHNKIEINGEKYTDLSAIKNKAGELISDILGNNYLSAAVDAAKDDYLTELGVTIDTGDVVALFERMGGDRDYLVAWLNQPIIQEYLALSKYYKSITYKATSNRKISKTDIIKEIMTNRGLKQDSVGYILERKENKKAILSIVNTNREAAGEYSVEDLQNAWFKSAETLDMNTHLFDDFLYLEDAAITLRESIATSKFDTSGPGKDIVESEQLKARYFNFVDRMEKDKGFTFGTIENELPAPYQNLIDNTLLKTFYNNSWKFVIPLYQPLLMMYKNNYINDALLGLINANKGIVVKKASTQNANLIYGSLINYVLQNNRGFNKELFYGENSVANKVLNIQENPNHLLHNNDIFNTDTGLFNIKLSNKTGSPDILIPKFRKYSSEDSTSFTRAFEEIKELDPQLYEDLLTVSLFQTGVIQSRSSFYNLLPYKDTAEIFQKALNNMDATTSDYITGVLENISNNVDNLKTVYFNNQPLAKKIKLDINDLAKTENYDFIRIYTNVGSGIYKKVSNNEFEQLSPKNTQSLYYNMTKKAEESFNSETEDQQEFDDYVPNNEELAEKESAKSELESQNKTVWNTLTSEQQINLDKVGITENLFNNLSKEEKYNLVKCHG